MAITVTNFVDYDGTDIHTQVLDHYPIGSIFINTSNINHSSFIGGVWESYGTGRTLVGVVQEIQILILLIKWEELKIKN